MILLAFVDFLITALAILTVVTQILLPAISGKPLFPYFRRRRKLEHKLAEAQEKIVEAHLEQKVVEVTRRADALRRSPINPAGSGKGAEEQKEDKV